jgi:serine/threonine-protein phosphatase 5
MNNCLKNQFNNQYINSINNNTNINQIYFNNINSINNSNNNYSQYNQDSIYIIKKGDVNYESSLSLAEKYKQEGNKYISEQKYNLAIEKYTEAIDLLIDTKNNAIYYSNRAKANIQIENFGSAIADANHAIDIDSTYLKAYYRRGSANLLLSRYDEALRDFIYIYNKCPDDSLLYKILECKKLKKNESIILKKINNNKFRIYNDDILKYTYDNITIENNYKGLIYKTEKITLEWVMELINKMIDLNNIKTYNEKYIHNKYLVNMLLDVKKFYMNQIDSLVEITIPKDSEITIVGDLHGQFYDLLNIFHINGFPSEKNPYIFNGDYVDRGVFSLECLISLLAFKLLYKNSIFINRGNHESKKLNKIYGFEKEIKDKCGIKYDIYSCFCEFFNCLPLGHILNKKVLIVHGGIFSKDGVKISDLKKINRFKDIPESGPMCEILWNDPCREKGKIPSKRGIGICFGPDITKKFLEENSLDLLIRSHEVKMEGYEIEPEVNVITIFSAPNYCDQMGNKGAIIRMKGCDLKPNFIQFNAVEHPNIPITKYFNPWMFT